MPTRVVSYFGVHWTESTEGLVAFLDQEKVDRRTEAIVPTGTNVRGYAAKSPFLVQPVRRGLRCPHRIQTILPTPDEPYWNVFKEMLERGGLVRVMAPIPRVPGIGGHYFVHPDGVSAADLNARIALMSNMCFPVGPIRVDADAVRVPQLLDELTVSNVAPVVLTGVEPRHTAMLRKLGEAAPTVPRCLVAIGSAAVPLQPGWVRPDPGIGIHRYEMELMAMVPWQQVGGTLTRLYMRAELGWFPDRPDLREMEEKQGKFRHDRSYKERS